MSGDAGLQSEIILYQTEDGRTRVQCRFDHDTLWLTQALIAELFQVSVPTVNEHLKGIYADGELVREATIRKFRIVRFEGARQVTREIEPTYPVLPQRSFPAGRVLKNASVPRGRGTSRGVDTMCCPPLPSAAPPTSPPVGRGSDSLASALNSPAAAGRYSLGMNLVVP